MREACQRNGEVLSALGAPFVQVLQAGSILDNGRYEVKSALKSGGMGAVYLLWDRRLERDCALKEMLSLSHHPAEMKEFRERFGAGEVGAVPRGIESTTREGGSAQYELSASSRSRKGGSAQYAPPLPLFHRR